MSGVETAHSGEQSVPDGAVALAVGMGLSMLGLVLHNGREFGIGGLLSPSTGTVPMVIIGVALVGLWWLIPAARKVGAILMIVYGAINLLGGGVLSVIPFDFLPFVPEQSFDHYLSHAIYTITQIPVIWVGLRYLINRPPAQAQEETA